MVLQPPPAIVVNNSTLRDGEQAGQVALSRRDKIDIALALEQVGVDEIELALSSPCDAAIEDLAQVGAALEHAKPILWVAATKRAVNAAVRAGLGAVYLSVPLSGRRISPDGFARVIEYACDRGLWVAVSGEDASRVDLDLVCDLIAAAEATGARRFRYADTMGVLHPLRTHRLFRQLCAETDLELEFRGRDDFALATANTLAAVQGGATHVSVSALRFSERPGIALLTDTARSIRLSTLHRTRIDFSRIPALATLISAATGRPFASGLPTPTVGLPRSIVPGALLPNYTAIPAVAACVGGERCQRQLP